MILKDWGHISQLTYCLPKVTKKNIYKLLALKELTLFFYLTKVMIDNPRILKKYFFIKNYEFNVTK